jgi:hypothetical protein
MRRLKQSRVARGVGFILAPILLVLTGGLFDLARAQQPIACDFLTAAGRVNATASGGVVRFELASGVKDGMFWGHLTYRDNGLMLKVDSTSITNYVATGTTTRVIEGTARTNLYGNRVFRVTATANGEPGGNDTFQIELDNGYFTHGTLLSGSVELLLGNLNSTPPPGFTCSDTTPNGKAQ